MRSSRFIALLLVSCWLAPVSETVASTGAFVEKRGVLLLEPEEAAAASSWTVENRLPGFTGSGYVAPGQEAQPLTFPIRITGWGRHHFRLRLASFDSGGATPVLRARMAGARFGRLTADQKEELLPAGEWMEMTSLGTGRDWSWETVSAEDAAATVMVRLSPGDYTLELAAEPGRSFALDRILVLQRDAREAEALDPAQPAASLGAPLPWRLSTPWPAERLAPVLLSPGEWKPYPKVDDRAAWQALPDALRARVIQAGEQALAAGPWQVLTATTFLDYFRTGRRTLYERERDARRQRLAALVLAECVEDSGRFLDEVANGVWLLCEESWWGLPAHLTSPGGPDRLPDIDRPSIDLFAPETASLLAWTDWLLGPRLDGVAKELRQRLRHEVKTRVTLPYLERDFGWMGLPAGWANNHNTSINSHAIAAVLLLEEDRERRAAFVAKALRTLDVFVHTQLPDGGCDEGPAYWRRAAAALIESLETLHHASGGQIDLMHDPLIQALARYFPAMHLAHQDFYNFGDTDRHVGVPAELLIRFGRQLDLPDLVAFGQWWLQQRSASAGGGEAVVNANLNRLLPAWFRGEALPSTPVQPVWPRDVWLPDTEIMIARDREGSTAGWTLVAIGGHNARSHNHNDVGSFVVYHDGQPVFIDVGRENYTSQSFDYSRRYDLWYTQSAWHNLPTIRGQMQAPGHVYAAEDLKYVADDAKARISMELSRVYPPAAGVEQWRRTLRLDRGEGITCTDLFALKDPGEVFLSLLTPRTVEEISPGVCLLHQEGAPSVRLTYPADALRLDVDVRALTDSKLTAAWGAEFRRLRLTARAPVSSGEWTVRIDRPE